MKRVKLDANKPSQLLGGKRLRSVSLERVSLVSKIPRQSEDDCYICDDTDTPDTPLHTAKNGKYIILLLYGSLGTSMCWSKT